MTIRAQGFSIVAANSQHRATTYQAIAHLVETQGWPAEKILIPGAIDTLSPVEEGDETVAELIERYAAPIGAEHVIAGNCGSARLWGYLKTSCPRRFGPASACSCRGHGWPLGGSGRNKQPCCES